MLTAVEFREKQARNLNNSLSDIKAGIDKVKEAPTKKAAEKKTKMLANLTKSVNDGTWERNLLKVSLQDWKDVARDVGVDRIPAGIAKAAGKVEKFATQFLPFVQNIADQVNKMSDLTSADTDARMLRQKHETEKFKLV